MAQTGLLFSVASTDGLHFTDALAQNASEAEELTLAEAIAAGRVCRARITQIALWASQNLSYEIQVFGRRGPNAQSPDPNLDQFLGRWEFNSADGVRNDGAGLYRYFISGLDIPYEDADRYGELHLRILNRSQVAKSSYGAGSHLRVMVWLEPTTGW